MKILYTLIFILCALTDCISQIIITDRPDQTESSSVVQSGSLQIESGCLIIEYQNHEEKKLYLPTTLFRIGLTKTIEFRVLNQFEYRIYETYSIKGFNNLECGIKMQLLKKENIGTELAFLTHIALPTSSNFFNENELSIINKLCISHKSNNNVNFGYNMGYNHHKNQTGDFTYSVVVGYGINDEVSTYIEPYGEVVGFKQYISNINMGITYLIKNNIQLDYSYGTGLNHKFNFMAIGLSINIF